MRGPNGTEKRSRTPPILAHSLGTRANALNSVRLALATSVIVSHTALVCGFQTPGALVNGDLGRWSVNGFFAISGYLVTGSRMRGDLRTYLARRSLRIMPGYWLVLLVTALVIAPASALISGEAYRPSSALSYVGSNAFLAQFQWDIEATLLAVPFPERWNIPLWTLFYEFASYVLAGTLLSIALVRRNALVATSLPLVLLTIYLVSAADPHDPVRLLSYFVGGMTVYFVRDLPATHGLAAASAALLVGLWAVGLRDHASQLPLAYLLLYLGAVMPIRIGATNDISYGMYIYAFPLQQVLVLAGGAALGYVGFTVVAILMTLPWAIASWHLVEKPAIRLPVARWLRGAGTRSHRTRV